MCTNPKDLVMKFAALDMGDVWVGTALSDALGIIAKPYQTVKLPSLTYFLKELFAKEKIGTVVIGLPKTMKGSESDQTKKVIAQHAQLQTLFPEINWVLWDERLSSKRADTFKKDTSKEEKMRSHSVAAAFILESYLTFHHNQQQID